MRNEAMTGTIFLSPEDSERIRNEIMHPSAEYLHNMQDYFERLASGMTILSQGSNTMVEFKNLDLSSLDALIEEDGVSAASETLRSESAYISKAIEVSFEEDQQKMDPMLIMMLKRLSFDVSNSVYRCAKNDKKTAIQGCNLTEAA